MTDHFKRIFTEDIPLLDVRAEAEFAKGAFPNACNIPILDDRERHEVGICYKKKGQEAAVALGHTLVSGDVKAARVKAWQAFIESHPGAMLYCFRGGQRSRIAAQWLAEAGTPIERIAGGYKAMRRYLLSQFDALPPLIVVAGRTGVGKTELLMALDNAIDLEGRANHRGSAFGGHLDPQPSQIDFENGIAIDLLKLSENAPAQPVFVEDESRMVGKVAVPQRLFDEMKTCPVILLEDALDSRVNRIHGEYVLDRWRACRERTGDEDAAHALLSDYLNTAMDAIEKRLGGQRHKELKAILARALLAQQDGDFECHKAWIEALLHDYYDPMYNYQIEKKKERVVFRGTRSEVLAWANSPEMRQATSSAR